MRISDWSSDVCSSDLLTATEGRQLPKGFLGASRAAVDRLARGIDRSADLGAQRRHGNRDADGDDRQDEGIFGRGRAALVLPKPLEEVTHGQSPFLGWFPVPPPDRFWRRSEEHTSELPSLLRISYAVFCL